MEVEVYSDADDVELLLNQYQLDEHKPEQETATAPSLPSSNPPCTLEVVAYDNGEERSRAVGTRAGEHKWR
ncbi:DUF4982 domain-containing protein [Arthrobacter sp. NPDC080073]|uniref:DUF4982 domain-containing protein n=1 Tax=Arthrobacter sp. NPDC080073 TaxID=3155919 RepID=UPI00343E2B82